MTFPSLEEVVSVIVALSPLFAILIPYLYQLLTGSLSAKNRALVNELVDTGVNVAEQIGAGMPGDKKKQIALNSIENLSAHYGVKLDPAITSDLIEAAVGLMNQYKAPAEKAPTNVPSPASPPDPSQANG